MIQSNGDRTVESTKKNTVSCMISNELPSCTLSMTSFSSLQITEIEQITPLLVGNRTEELKERVVRTVHESDNDPLQQAPTISFSAPHDV